MRVMNLAIQIADAEVRSIVEIYCNDGEVADNGVVWMDTETSSISDEAKSVLVDAIQYIELRTPTAFPWRLVRHPDKPHLVRFEDSP